MSPPDVGNGIQGEGESPLLPALPQNIVNPATGEVLPATPGNAAGVLRELRTLRGKVNDAVRACSAILIEESRRVGTKTLRLGDVEAKVSGGSEIVWDVGLLLEGLRKAGCPEGRLEELVKTTIEYRVDQSVARQLAGANPEYAEAIEAAKERVPAPTRVSVSP